ncbi:MAG: metallophosphoesterase [Clostridia bacterium]|nr:metallophosphoesterase [Clostridia bacterium]
MKKILVFSDSHGYKEGVDLLFNRIDEFDYVYFLGDGYGDVEDYRNAFPDKVEAVLGNCDRYFDGTTAIVNKVEGVTFLLTHGHEYHVKHTYDLLLYTAEKKNADCVLFGHTHYPADFYQENVRFINPGALGNAYFRGTYAVLTVNGENLVHEQFDLADLQDS